ncbi:MAG TPA: D-alanyl-D-alanine dipeptidase [Sediminispirochaeta sp.]|nr:D-alanyl-D-alanine dipeptidase [Sediminispirochaeta sp.]
MGLDTIKQAIPPQASTQWQGPSEVQIEENGEPLVPAGSYPERIIVRSAYYEQNYPHALSEVYLRRGLFEQLVLAADTLPPSYRLVLFDGWRPVELQKLLFDEYVEEILCEQKNLDRAEAEKRASVFVAPPSTDPAQPSPHATGGSVDLSIVDQRGELLDMGGAFDEKSERSLTRYYEAEAESKNSLARDNRRMLYHCLFRAGFSNYPEEWWHYDFGNQNWVYYRGFLDPQCRVSKARYGITQL